MEWNKSMVNLRDALADLYFDFDDSVVLIRESGLSPAKTPFHKKKATTNWTFILDYAEKQQKIGDIVDRAREEYPHDPVLNQFVETGANSFRGADIETDVSWNGEETEGDRLEKIMGQQSTLLPVSFLETGFARADAVVRIVTGDGSLGSGFFTSENLIITNNHVISSAAQAKAAKIQFNFQKNPEGLDLPFESTRLSPELGFSTSPEHDWTAIHISEKFTKNWRGLVLSPEYPQKNERAIIIQHPGGDSKQIGLYHNMIAYSNEGSGRVQYWTDTLPGSSGSPVFNDDWKVIALHHSGGRLKEPGTKLTVYRNEGIHINTVIEGINEAKKRGDL